MCCAGSTEGKRTFAKKKEECSLDCENWIGEKMKMKMKPMKTNGKCAEPRIDMQKTNKKLKA